jgi:hypothetical protein
VTAKLVTLSLPLPWTAFGLPAAIATSVTTLTTGDVGWRWEPDAPALPVVTCPPADGTAAPGWDVDHVVLLTPGLEETIRAFDDIGLSPRLRLEVKGRPTAFFRVGPVLEVIESPVRAAALYGVALVTQEPLESVVLRWRSSGLDVTDPRPAMQPGRRIFTVRAVEAGLAVMSPDRATG